MFLRELFERKFFLAENVSAGSQNVLSNKKLVESIAGALRSDFSVPMELKIKFRRMKDEDVAKWFCEQLDRIERQGYDGVVFGRNGQFNLWIANNYAQGADIWEDIEGEMGPALRDFVILKNRNMLEQGHNDVQRYKGVKALHRYMVQHYADALAEVRQTAAMASMLKSARSVLLADTPEYKLYYLQNRPAAVAWGKGATFCTANSNSDHNFKAYSKKAPLFGLLPKGEPKQDTSGRLGGKTFQEKFQFDASDHAASANFRNNLDHQVPPKEIQERFPYLWDDLSKGISANASEFAEPSEEPGVQKLQYDPNKELDKLRQNLSSYWTKEKRPVEEPPSIEGDTPPQLPPQA
jgi:hypothetical protein